jgi:hypothetical protein
VNAEPVERRAFLQIIERREIEISLVIFWSGREEEDARHIARPV